ncbi:MAG: AbrB/MazE/SpoVT family DNA-binding domain-containing protein [Thermodesulfobacteriota bacterium]
MVTTITTKGQVSIPADIRKRFNLVAGDKVEFEIVGGEIRLRPVVTLTIPREQTYFWNKEVQDQIKASEDDLRADRFKEFDNADEGLKWLKSE